MRKNYVDPLWAVRTYALVSIAQHDAMRMAGRSEAAPDHDPAFLAVVVAASSATVLARLYPHEVPRLAADLERDVGSAGALSKAALDLAVSAGESAGRAVLDERENDGALSLDAAVSPAGEGRWRSSERWPALRPSWGKVRPFLIPDADAFVVPPPPPLESEPFRAALADVREHTRRASARLDGIAKKWADGPGTSTPAGHWNEIWSPARQLHRRMGRHQHPPPVGRDQRSHRLRCRRPRARERRAQHRRGTDRRAAGRSSGTERVKLRPAGLHRLPDELHFGPAAQQLGSTPVSWTMPAWSRGTSAARRWIAVSRSKKSVRCPSSRTLL